jgi:epoxyqueuosine reductase
MKAAHLAPVNCGASRLPCTGVSRHNDVDDLTPTGLKNAIRAHAAELGFALCGFTTGDAPAHHDVFEAWLAARRHGDMDYLAADRARSVRANPLRLMPACRTIIALGFPYSPAPALAAEPLAGRVAAYALGDDYHQVLPARARQLAEAIGALTHEPVQWRVVCDTAPVHEREFGQRAGLGWIGKNGMLISPQHGSYLLLAELLISLDLPPDPPFAADRCGACRRCLEACPTHCIRPDRTLDATRCIAYLTIENRGDIPEALRPAIGLWAFGCDICQEVCPWNAQPALPAVRSALDARPHFPLRDMGVELLADEGTFAERFHRSALRRTRRSGWRRNLIIALGNTRRAEAVRALSRILTEPDPRLRRHAAWALAQVAGSGAALALRAALETESEAAVRRVIHEALSQIDSRQGHTQAAGGSG